MQHAASKSNPSLESIIVSFIATIAALKAGDTATFPPVVEHKKEEEEIPVAADMTSRN